MGVGDEVGPGEGTEESAAKLYSSTYFSYNALVDIFSEKSFLQIMKFITLSTKFKNNVAKTLRFQGSFLAIWTDRKHKLSLF